VKLFFFNKDTVDNFKNGKFELSAQISAVAVKKGVSTDTVYNNGIAIFTFIKAGLLYEASLDGQKFTFKPIQ